MSVDDPRGKKEIWGGVIEFDDSVADPATEEFKTELESRLREAEDQKKVFLDILSKASLATGNLVSPDVDEMWGRLRSVMSYYLVWKLTKDDAARRAKRCERLKGLRKNLSAASNAIEELSSPELRDDLAAVWWEGSPEHLLEVFSDLLYVDQKFDEAVKKLSADIATARDATNRAVQQLSVNRGRPSGTSAIPRRFICALGKIYRDSTGAQPGAGEGLFADFVGEFLTSMRSSLAQNTVIDAIKKARQFALSHPSGWAPSVFEK